MQDKSDSSAFLDGLNKKQKEAVLSEYNRLLVLAGAGSGKTKTIIQKILFLISEKNVDPANILAITFTKNASNEMIDRLILYADKDNSYSNILFDKKLSFELKEYKRREYIKKYPWLSNITVRTFHSLCYSLLRKHGSQFDNKFKIIDDKTYDEDIDTKHKAPENPRQIFQKIIKQVCEDTEYLLKLKRYILDYYVDEHRKRMHELGYQDYERPYTTLGDEQVASKSERYIADWLYTHNIDYVYEPKIAIKDFEFKPDFYIPSADLYLEHISNLSHPIKDKEEQFKIGNKVLIKTYETMVKDIRKFHQYLDKTVISKINKDIKREVALSVEAEFRTYFKQLDEFVSMVIAVLDKIKVENSDLEEIFKKASKDPHDRVKIFYELAKPLIEEYKEYCIKRSYLDFNDLIILTISLLKKDVTVRNAFQQKFRHILVDEFQDVNTLQVKLIKYLLIKSNQLFCVGDDWQSIYGWRGSEVDYIVNFKKYFENSKIIKLNLNYRSNNTIVQASNEVIKNNKHKIDKEISSINKEGRKIYLYCAQREEEDGVEIVVKKIQQFLQNGYNKDDILVLYRRTKAIDPYKDLLRGMAKLKTIHSAKGLEAKIVFIVGLNGGIYGFPQVWESDRILQVIKASNFELLMEEERRLFYVAITRAKEELFLISEVGNESQFIRKFLENLLTGIIF
jgi:DNA helicase IV